ncbi:phosphotransferase family protein [Oceanobacillus caeni]|uniref:phosphotransferase family protein n=1 Tax=Bacillaceae TaxID=186817 RepID=UPI0006217B8F|nr:MULTISPECIES: phosphotransferase family protein [Bacillaceae]KKE79765.1 aminoglycoside phosphotransferase [Bacilli bacterium VT-13-104]PZD89521.1 phosphotransferase family protein [Bacilli bacterium]MCR1832972.1 phosphotransferase family protein [Oceanobacillus caeni]PZD91043.1 phosphotransferase family protein [Bacilli bacterium]PZD92590.1 phosphotransferase family protein [Bacilli bacterium]
MQKDTADRSIDWKKVEDYIRANLDGIPNGEMKIKQFTEGYSNLTYMIKIGNWEAVLRRPPFGYTPPKAHDMEREYRILDKINPVFPLAPKPFIYCEDPEIMDKHFYIMEKRNGVVIDDDIPSQFGKTEETGRNVSEAVIKALVDLQSIDIEKSNLRDIGKPEGYLTRQVYGWMKRHKNSKTDDIEGNIENIEKWLVDHLPTNEEATIVHNDFKLNNMMFDRNDSSKIVGVFDWELATVGDPLTDLGSTLAYWIDEDVDVGITAVTSNVGFYNRREFLERYVQLSGRDVTDINFYLTFGFYKLAGILQQLYYRWKIGEVKDERFSTLNKGISNLMELAEDARNNRLL